MQERTDTRALADVALRAGIMALVFTTVLRVLFKFEATPCNLCATATRFLNLLNKPGFFSTAPPLPLLRASPRICFSRFSSISHCARLFRIFDPSSTRAATNKRHAARCPLSSALRDSNRIYSLHRHTHER